MAERAFSDPLQPDFFNNLFPRKLTPNMQTRENSADL